VLQNYGGQWRGAFSSMLQHSSGQLPQLQQQHVLSRYAEGQSPGLTSGQQCLPAAQCRLARAAPSGNSCGSYDDSSMLWVTHLAIIPRAE
jgi:hypothetical protein